MKYNKIIKAKFIKRPNRFIAYCEIDNEIHKVHVKNTGKCRELLVPNCSVYLEESDNINRKTKYSLISVIKEERLINMDSQVPNKIVIEALKNKDIVLEGFKDITFLKSEKTYNKSRFDVYLESNDKKAFVEVKGVTLEENNIVMFPDAKTERGVKHINELIEARLEGYEAFILFIVQMKGVNYFTPNEKMHKELKDALINANQKGVKILSFDCNVDIDEININKEVKVIL